LTIPDDGIAKVSAQSASLLPLAACADDAEADEAEACGERAFRSE
jgi:hypothetical protein